MKDRFALKFSIFALSFALLTLGLSLWNWSLPLPAHAQTPSYTVDPCMNPGTAPLNKSVAIVGGTATSTLLVALTAGKQVWVCEWTLMIGVSATTATSVQFEYGTQTTNPCDTGTTVLTGAMGSFSTTAGPALLNVNGPYSGATMETTAGQQLCLVTAGPAAGINVAGQVTYKVQ